jgi:hypothetical protein
MKTLLTALVAFSSLYHHASAKAYFQAKEEMVQRAEVIAMISITAVRDSDSKGVIWTYRKSGEGTVEKVLKGDIPKNFTLHGAETFICASCPLAEGRFLAFLKKDGELWTGSNWHLSLRPITGTEVLWYVDAGNRYEMKATSLDAVLAEIKETAKMPEETNGDKPSK